MAITLNDAEKIFESDSWDTTVDQMSDKELSDLMSAFQSTNDYARREKNTDNYIYVQTVGEKRLKDLEGKDFSTMSASELDGVLSLLETFGSSTAEIDSIKHKYEERLSVLRAESENSESSDNTGQEQNNIQTPDETPATETPDIEQETEKANEVETANIARISDFYGIDHIQAPEQVEANIQSLSSLPNDEECFQDETFKDIKRLLDAIDVHHDVEPATSGSTYNNDMQMFCETVRKQTEMYLANISPNGVKPEDFKQEYADRLSTHLASVLGIDTAIKSKPSQESVSKLLDGLANGQKHVIESSTLIGWQAAQHAEMDKATDLISQKKGYENVARSFKQKVHELKDKVQEKYPKSYSLAKTALTSAGWGAAFSIGASFGPVGIAAVSAASFANSSYKLYKDYKHQKEEHLQKGEKYNFFSYVKENKLRCLSTMLSGLSAAVGGVSLGGIDASALQNVVSQSRQIVGYAMAASSAFKAAGDAWNKTEGSWWDKLKSSARAAVTSAASFAAGYAAGQTVGAVAGDIAGTPASEQQDTTQNTAQQTGQTLASQTIQPVRENITMPVDTPSQVSQPQVLDAQVMGGATPPVHETPTTPAHETPTTPAHETPTTPAHETPTAPAHETPTTSGGETTLEAQENPEMPNTGPHVGWMTENGDSYVFNQETQEFTFTSNNNSEESQIVHDQETFQDIYTRLQNGEEVSYEEMQWGREHLDQMSGQGSQEGQTLEAQIMENPAPTNSDPVYFNEEGGQAATPEGQTLEAQENPQMPNTGQYEGHMTDSGVSFVVNHETGEISVSGTNPEIEQAASSLAANSSLSVEQAQNMLRDQEAFKDIATRLQNGENVSDAEKEWARNHYDHLKEQGLQVNNDWSISPVQNAQEGQTITQETPAQEAPVQDTSVHQAGGMSYSFDENGRLAMQGTPSSELYVQDQQVTQFQTEDGRTMYRCGATVSPNLGIAQKIEGDELRNIAASHDVYNDLAARQENGETLSQAEQNFMHNHEQQIEQHHLVVTEDGHLRTEAHDERVREAEANAGQTLQNETPSQGKEEIEAQNTALPSTKEIAGKAGIQLIGEKAVNLPADYMKDHGNISIVCDQNDMIVSMQTADGQTQSVCASLGEDGKYSFQKIDENGNASPMSDKEIKAFQKDVLKPAAKAAEAYHEKSGNHFDLSHSKNISLMQDAAKRGNISR